VAQRSKFQRKIPHLRRKSVEFFKRERTAIAILKRPKKQLEVSFLDDRKVWIVSVKQISLAKEGGREAFNLVENTQQTIGL
jgi:hypothetical protein